MIFDDGKRKFNVEYCGRLTMKCSGRSFDTFSYKDNDGLTHHICLDHLSVIKYISQAQ